MSKAGFALLLLPAFPLAGIETEGHETWNRQKILTALSGLHESAELECYAQEIASSEWAGMQDEIAELHGGPLSPYDGLVFPNYHYVQIEHIVARKEADESGLCSRGEQSRTQFAKDLLNLTLAPGSLNASKGDDDAHDLETAERSLFRDNLTDHGLCWWAAQTVRVKSKYQLSVNTDEKSSLKSILDSCSDSQVYRPKLAEGSDWVFRREFLDELTGERSISSCSETATDSSGLSSAVIAVSSHLSSVACLPEVSPDDENEGEPETTTTESMSTEMGVGDPREAQKAAQTACIQTLESRDLRTNCTNVEDNCPDVGPIRSGEPLYGSLRDADNDGVVCEGL